MLLLDNWKIKNKRVSALDIKKHCASSLFEEVLHYCMKF